MERIKPADKPKAVKDVVIKCMDFRYHEDISRILRDNHDVNFDQVDQLTIGGSSKAVVDGSLKPSLEIAYAKHKARNVYIFDHIDCGGFGTLAAFDNDEQKEAQAHFASIDQAQAVINKMMPEFVVVSYVVGLDGEPIAH